MARRKTDDSTATKTTVPVVDVIEQDSNPSGTRTRLSDQLYGKVFDQITSGRFKVGEQLPSEVDIAEQFGVSRPVVREALLRLRVDGLITSRQGLGTFVSHQPALRTKVFAEPQDIASYLRCQELRITLEGDAARLAAERHTDEQLTAIAAAHDAFSSGVHTGNPTPAADLEFHARIAEASGNEFYSNMLESIHGAMVGLMRLTLGLTRTASKKRALTVLGEHSAIVSAIRAREGEQARVAMQFHLGQARRRLIDRRRDK